jgi:hypothetical protein
MAAGNRKWIGNRSELYLLAFFVLTFGGMAGAILLDKLKLPAASDTPLRLTLLVCAFVGVFFRFAHATSLSNRFKTHGVPANPQEVFWTRIVALLLWVVVLPLAILRAYDYIHRLRH